MAGEKMEYFKGDILKNFDATGELINIEDFIAAGVAIGLDRRRGNEMWIALYGFVGSVTGRMVTNIDYGEGMLGTIMNHNPHDNSTLASAVVQAILVKGFLKGSYLTAFEKAAATQIIAKLVGKKISFASSKYPRT